MTVLLSPVRAADSGPSFLDRNPQVKEAVAGLHAAVDEVARSGPALDAVRREYSSASDPARFGARRDEARIALKTALDRLRDRKRDFDIFTDSFMAAVVFDALRAPTRAPAADDASHAHSAIREASSRAFLHIQSWEPYFHNEERMWAAAAAKAARAKARRRLQTGGGLLAAAAAGTALLLWLRRRRAARLPFGGYAPAGPARPWAYGVQYAATGPRPAALKLLSAEFAGTGAEAALTAERLRKACAFRHPGVVAFLAAGVAPEGVYLVTEPEAGKPLSGPLGEPEPLGPARTLAALTPVARALDAAHRAGFAHGALSPACVLLGPDGSGRLTDFGVARALAVRVGARALSPVYSAPEQREGEAKLPSDLYAFGVVLYEALFGRPPFEGQNLVALKEEGRFPKPSALWGRPAPEADALFEGLLEPKARARRPPPGGLEAALAAVRF